MKRRFSKSEFIVVCYPVSFCGVHSKEWCRVTCYKSTKPTECHEYVTKCSEIDPDQAHQLIRDAGLVKVYEDKNGKVYDTPECSFQNKFKGATTITWI